MAALEQVERSCQMSTSELGEDEDEGEVVVGSSTEYCGIRH